MAGTTKRGTKTSAARIAQALKDREVLDARVEGWTLQRIADEWFSGHRANAGRAIQRILREHVAEGVEDLRALQNARLEALHAELWKAVMVDGDMNAARLVLQGMERSAKLNGLDARAEVEGGNVTVVVDSGLTTGTMAAPELVVDDPQAGDGAD